MSALARVGLVIAAIAIGLAALAWWQQDEILLALVERAAAQRTPAGPPREIEWSHGRDPDRRPIDARPPNIVVILADDLGWNDVSYHGGGVADGTVPTPGIDALARRGASFTAGYSANGTCAPSRAAIMTGRYGTRFGFEFTPTPPGMSSILPRVANRMPGRLRETLVHDVDETIAYEDSGMPPSEITLAELLRDAGYHTVHIGKWHLGRAEGMAPHEQGFDESLLMASGLYLPEDHPDVVDSKQDFDPIDRFLWRALDFAASFNGSEPFEPGGYLTDYYTDQAVEVIKRNRDRPFFLYLAHWAPHTPLQATREDYEAVAHVEDHRQRVYAAMVKALDRSVSRVLRALRENNVDENTLVFFTSDNGAPNYIGLPDVNRPYRGWKISFFEGGIRVPYLMAWPGRVPEGVTFDAPVHGFDLFATAAAAAGVPLPEDRVIDGVDLVPWVRGERAGRPHDALFWRTGHYRVVRAGDWKLQLNERAPGAPWLFDLAEDPGETTNLADRHPGKVAELRALIEAHDAEQAPPLWPSRVEMPVKLDTTLAEPDEPDDVYIYWPN